MFSHLERETHDLSDTKETTYQLLVHQSLVFVYTVELVLKNNLRQGVIEELPGKQCHEVLKGALDVSRSF